jgi:hypothetical protein
MIRKSWLISTALILLILTNIITYTFTLDRSKEIFTNLLNNCLDKNLSKKEIVTLQLYPEKNGFTVSIDNNTECLIIKEIEAEIEYLNLGKSDTLKLSVTEPINPLEKGSIFVDEVKVDSLRIINYSLLKVDIF